MARGYHWTVAVCAALFSVAAFATDYTWTGGGTNDLWLNPENWGETANYPGKDDRAIFPAGQPITVTISQNDTVGTIDLRDYSFIGDRVIDVTFRGAAATGTNCVLTVKTKFDIYAPLGTITLDNAAIKVSAGELKLGKGRSLHLINGANLYSASRVYVSNASTFELSGRSVANINGVTVEGNARLFSIDDSSVFLRDTAYFDTTDSAGALIRFSGSNPLIYWSANKGAFYFSRSVTANMVFSIPAGGYAAPPIQQSLLLFERRDVRPAACRMERDKVNRHVEPCLRRGRGGRDIPPRHFGDGRLLRLHARRLLLRHGQVDGRPHRLSGARRPHHRLLRRLPAPRRLFASPRRVVRRRRHQRHGDGPDGRDL